MKIPLLLTSAVNVSAVLVEIRDADRRIALTMDAIREWIRIEPNIEIVICDGSGHDFTLLVKQTFPDNKIECLHFQNNEELVRTRGKGFGEGEIVNYALSHSKFISTADCFAKCTSKLWVDNYHKCLLGFNGILICEIMYYENSLYNYRKCDTRFYITDKTFYIDTIANCHTQVDDERWYYLEHAFADAIRGKNLRSVLFREKPLIYGFSGTTGGSYVPTPDSLKSVLLRRIRYLFGYFDFYLEFYRKHLRFCKR